MALYLAEGGDSDRLLGLTCRHVLIGSSEANVDYSRHPSRPRKDVLLLGERAFGNLVDCIKVRIARHGISAKLYRRQTERFEAREASSTNAVDVEKSRRDRIATQDLLDEANKAVEEFGKLGIFVIDRAKLGDAFKGNKIDLGTF